MEKLPLSSWSDERYFSEKAKEEAIDYFNDHGWSVPQNEIRNVFATLYKDGSASFFVAEEGYLISRGEQHISSTGTESDADRARRRAKKIIRDLIKNNRAAGSLFITLTNGRQDTVDDDTFLKQVLTKFRHMKERLNADFKYLLIPERHHTSGRVHFHGVLWGYPEDKLIYSGKLAKTVNGSHLLHSIDYRGKKWDKFLDLGWRPVYNLALFKNNGFTTATKIESYEKATSYMTKYITKDMDKIYKQYYFRSNNLDLPEYQSYYCPMLSQYFKSSGDLTDFESPGGLYWYVNRENMQRLKVNDVLQQQLQPLFPEFNS